MKTIPKTIKFTPELIKKVTKIAEKKKWSFHKTVLIILTEA